MTKTVTPQPREGNRPVRIAETEAGMLNSIGLENPGIDGLLREKLPRLAELGVPLWVSVGGFAAADYAQLCAALADRPEVSAIELNLSCPNVEEAPESAAELVAAARPQTRKTLYAKLSPAATDLPETARAVQAAGADGLSLVNTIRGLALDDETLQPRLGHELGGYSGPALKPIALAAVYQISWPLARARSRSERSSSGTPTRPAECAANWPRSSLRGASRAPRPRPVSRTAQSPSLLPDRTIDGFCGQNTPFARSAQEN